MSDNDPNIIQDHPEFPFGETLARERLERWEESFEGRPEPDAPAAALLQEFLEFVERYSFLERIVQGEIRYELPVHPRFLDQRDRDDDPLEQQAAELAEAEAELLGQPEVPSLGLLDELEELGIKVVTTSRSATSELIASFFFEGETGPAFLVGTDRDDPRAVFAIAHLLGHYIADYDPYHNRVCRWHPESLENLDESPSEVRADLFARALLVPEDPLRRYLEQLAAAVSSGETSAERAWEILATLFGVPEPILVDRMSDLGFEALAGQLRLAANGGPMVGTPESGGTAGVRPEDVASGEDSERGSALPGSAERVFLLPSRYLNLALACYHERVMERDVLGQFLGMGDVEIEAVLQWSQVGRRPLDESDDEADREDEPYGDGDGDRDGDSDGDGNGGGNGNGNDNPLTPDDLRR